jgi:hypothetical protein
MALVGVTLQWVCLWEGIVHLPPRASARQGVRAGVERWLMGLLHNGASEQRWGLEEDRLVHHELSFPPPSTQSLRNPSVPSQDAAGSNFSPAEVCVSHVNNQIKHSSCNSYHHRRLGLHEI